MGTIIKAVSSCVPKNKVLSSDIEEKLSRTFSWVSFWILEEMTWVKQRYFVSDNEYPSDLSVQAGRECLEESEINKKDIDLLIFASASQDITEPATANIVQKWLWLECPVFDIKNACNSFLNAMDIADSLLESWKYENILIVSWETPSKAIKFDKEGREEFKNYFAGYTLWDAGAAMLLWRSLGKNWIQHSYFCSDGKTWDFATIMWGGARFFNDVSKNYFFGDPGKIRDKFISMWSGEFDKWLEKLGWEKSSIKKVFAHQVAMSNFDYLSDILWVEKQKFSVILPEYGNIASCCIPTSFDKYIKTNNLEEWDRIVFMWFASGFSYGLIFYEV